jgi:hypothetical protein
MTATQSTLSAPGFRGRAATILVSLVFAIGVFTGLVVARLPWPSLTSSSGVATAPDPNWPAYRDYRVDERNVPAATFTSDQIQQTWMDFRAGERDDPPTR